MKKNLRCLGYRRNYTTRLGGDFNKPLEVVPIKQPV